MTSHLSKANQIFEYLEKVAKEKETVVIIDNLNNKLPESKSDGMTK